MTNNNPIPGSNPANEELSRSLDRTPSPPPYITGGCLCGKVRYRAEIGTKYAWPPGPHTCSCTHCRKHTGAPFALFLTFTCPQLGWPSPETGVPNLAIPEYSHTPGRYRGFCSTCGSTMYFRCPAEDGDEIEMGVGTVDEELLEKYGRALGEPKRGRYYAGREIYGVGFGGEFKPGVGGHRYKQGSRSEIIE